MAIKTYSKGIFITVKKITVDQTIACGIKEETRVGIVFDVNSTVGHFEVIGVYDNAI
jgi:hypothetical protein